MGREDKEDRMHDTALVFSRLLQRLSQQISNLHKPRFVSFKSNFSIDIDVHFDRSFNVAMNLTVRALMIKGVSQTSIALVKASLRQQQLQQTKDLLVTSPPSPGKSLPSCKPPRDRHAVRRAFSLNSLVEGSHSRLRAATARKPQHCNIMNDAGSSTSMPPLSQVAKADILGPELRYLHTEKGQDALGVCPESSS